MSIETKYEIEQSVSRILNYLQKLLQIYLLCNVPDLFIASRSVNMVIECIDYISDNGYLMEMYK